MSDKIRQALCCECGEIRTCRRARNRQHENYWLAEPVDPNWHRELGDLKCSNCERVTRHALLVPEEGWWRDHAERLTRIALGAEDYGIPHVQDRIRAAYRQGRQANPLMKHLWSRGDEEAARKAGKATVRTHCGETQKLPTKTRWLTTSNEPLKPDPVRFEQEYEDSATGAWWVEMDCPDCYRVSNARRAAQRRELLTEWLAWALRHHSERVPDERVEDLIAAFKSAAGES